MMTVTIIICVDRMDRRFFFGGRGGVGREIGCGSISDRGGGMGATALCDLRKHTNCFSLLDISLCLMSYKINTLFIAGTKHNNILISRCV